MTSPASDTAGTAEPAPSQTLSRGLRILEVLAEQGPLSIPALSSALGLHRSITYRMLRTLEQHRLVTRDGSGIVRLGLALAALAQGVEADLQSVARTELARLADDVQMTAFLTGLDGTQCVSLVACTPTNVAGAVVYRPGSQHSLAVGGPGVAIQSVLTAEQWSSITDVTPRDNLAEVRRLGFATSHSEVIPGLRSVAVPLVVPGHPLCAAAVIYVSTPYRPAELGRRLREVADRIVASMPR